MRKNFKYLLFFISITIFSQEKIFQDGDLEFFCKKKDGQWSIDGNICGYTIVKNGKKLQELKDLKSIPSKFIYEDIDMDGIQDFRIATHMDKSPYNLYFAYFIFNRETGFYYRQREFENITRPKYDIKNKQIRSIRLENDKDLQIIEIYQVKNHLPKLIKKVTINCNEENNYSRIKLIKDYDYVTNQMVSYWETENNQIGYGEEYYTINKDKEILNKKIITLIGLDDDKKTIYTTETWELIDEKLKLTKKEVDVPRWDKTDFNYIEFDETKD